MEIKDLSLGIVQGVTPLLTLVFNLHLNLHFSTLMLLSPSFHLLISPQTCFLSSRLDLFPHVCWLFCYLITCIITFNYSFCLQFRHLNNWQLCFLLKLSISPQFFLLASLSHLLSATFFHQHFLIIPNLAFPFSPFLCPIKPF